MPHSKTVRVPFTKEHDIFLFKYLATYCPTKAGRHGNKIYDELVANRLKKWPWSVYHTSQSWRERYVKNADRFDKFILNYQKKHEMKPEENLKRSPESVSTEMHRPNAKRIKLEKKQEGEGTSSSEARAATRREYSSASKPKSASKPQSKRLEAPAPVPHSTRPEPTCASRTPPVASPPRPNAKRSVSVTKNLAYSPTPVQAQHEIIEIPSSPPDRQPPPATNGVPESDSSPRHVKRIKVRHRSPSDVFASEPSSPRLVAPAAPVGSVEVSSSQAPPAPPAPGTSANGDTGATAMYPRVPPRLVDSFHGQVLVDRDGRVPRALPRREKDESEEEKGEKRSVDTGQWPPARGTAQRRRTSGPDTGVDSHHAFSQPQPPPLSYVPRENGDISERERPFTADGALLDRRTVAALFSGQSRHSAVPQASSERREDVVQNGASPVKRIVTTIPPSDPFSGHIPKPLSRVFKFPAPRASTRSPFRPELSAQETHHPPPSQPRLQPRPRPPSRARAARHPALARVRRQTIENGNRHEHEHGRDSEVPSLDLVALSHSTASRSHSRSSRDTSVPARQPRWSLPTFAHSTPWMFDEPERWAASSSAYGDLWRGRGRTSTPRFVWTPSPARSIVGTSPSVADITNGIRMETGTGTGIPALPPASLAPHLSDLQLAASHGLASILAHMSANHGLALDVVKAVYERVGSLREADEVLGGMREAAAGFGEREIERRERVRHGVGGGRNGRERGEGQGQGSRKSDLRYVVASDGEGSEYSPPETSRAAMWKRQSELSYAEKSEERGDGEDGAGEQGKDDDEEAEGREVEEELRDRDEDEDDGGDGTHHDFSRRVPADNDGMTGQARDEDDGSHDAQPPKDDVWEAGEGLVEDIRLAQETEKKLGKERYRRGIARLFVSSV